MKIRINFKSPVFKILIIYLIWRSALILISFLAVNFIPLGYKDRFLGGGLVNYSLLPQFFSWANFDGEHYLSIAIFGYKHLEQAFFPVYPMLISFFSGPNYDLLTPLVNSALVGLIISNVSFVFALIFLWELIRMDFSQKIAYLTIIMLLIFPTSFYFGAVYNESLFLFLSVLTFYCARKGKWLLAGILGAAASATRVFGLLLFPALLIEAYQAKASLKDFIWIFLIPLGLGGYMWYLFVSIGDPIAFYNYQRLIGEQHQQGVITLPQVYFRYIKMMATTPVQNPIFQTLVLEFLSGILFFLLPVYGYFKKIRLSYLFYAMIGFIIPTIQGSFSSTPRYVLILFPSFLAVSIWISNLSNLIKTIIFILLVLLLVMETAFFLRGYWIA